MMGANEMMRLTKIDPDFSVCKIRDITRVDFSRDFVFVFKTDEEISLVCESGHVPENPVAVEAGWKAFRIGGILDFGLIGVIAGITGLLAEAEIGVFVISTYNTDYLFLKAADFDRGIVLLGRHGYTIC